MLKAVCTHAGSTPAPIMTSCSLDELMADVEALTPNAHVGVIRALIARHDLYYRGAPISPGTGGRNGRTKFDMLQEVRHAVGADPLPDSALRARRARPDVPMGKPVARPDGHRIDFDSPKAPRSVEPDALLALGSGFFAAFVPAKIEALAGLDPAQKRKIRADWRPADDPPTFTAHLRDAVNDVAYNRLLNAHAME